MKIALCSSFVPFINGGARFIVEWLAAELRKHGHQTEIIWLPFVEARDSMFRQMMAYRLIDLADTVEKLIAFRPPAYVIPHPNKTLWFIHHFREYYDLWTSMHRSSAPDSRSEAFRSRLIAADTAAIGEARHIFTNSRVVSDRLKHFNGLDSEVLYPPIHRPERFKPGAYGDEIVSVCRMESHKRQELFVEAMRFVKSGVKLRLCGLSHDGKYGAKLQRMVARHGLKNRVTIEHRWISEDEKAAIVSDALGITYAPIDEDSYGYPTLEGALAEKPVVTASDSGGTLEFVENGRNGFVCDPSPQSLAAAFDTLWQNREQARRMGITARERIGEMRIDWSHVVERITA
jgi:glycosyltransferase involved in cell wall biosynthesis